MTVKAVKVTRPPLPELRWHATSYPSTSAKVDWWTLTAEGRLQRVRAPHLGGSVPRVIFEWLLTRVSRR